jgi:D-amino-acid oxidase
MSRLSAVERAGERIAVIGGGIVGITTATLLQANGYSTVLYTVARPDTFDKPAPPEFASLHAAASILPHSIESPHSTRWTEASQELLQQIALRPDSGVRTQRHYEIFEVGGVAPPEYDSAVSEFQMLSESELRTRGTPVRPGASALSGWSFSIFFCEAPTYLRFLYRFFQAIGGTVASASELPEAPTLSAYLARDHRVYVLCAGYASGALAAEATASGRYADRPLEGLFEPLADPAAVRFIRGHYLRLDARDALRDGDGRPFSYNYTPSSDVYPTSGGSAGDVYCYPRTVGWLLGGSRQVGRLDESGKWSGEASGCEEIDFPGGEGTVRLPAPIFDLNRVLLASTTGLSFSLERLREATPPRITGGVGYRFSRDDPNGDVRVGVSRLVAEDEKIIATNYGHGGAGYTLSWGTALDTLALITPLADRGPLPSHESERDGRTRGAIAAASDRLLGRD